MKNMELFFSKKIFKPFINSMVRFAFKNQWLNIKVNPNGG